VAVFAGCHRRIGRVQADWLAGASHLAAWTFLRLGLRTALGDRKGKCTTGAAGLGFVFGSAELAAFGGGCSHLGGLVGRQIEQLSHVRVLHTAQLADLCGKPIMPQSQRAL
jgi:hypothetical protein